jgi:hypothetical protein
MNESQPTMVAASFNPAHHARVNPSHQLECLPTLVSGRDDLSESSESLTDGSVWSSFEIVGDLFL